MLKVRLWYADVFQLHFFIGCAYILIDVWSGEDQRTDIVKRDVQKRLDTSSNFKTTNNTQ